MTLIEKIILLVVGSIVGIVAKLVYDKISKPKRKLRVESYHSPVETGALVSFKVCHTGNETVNDLRMRFQCAGEDVISDFCYYVDEELKCERLDQKTMEGDASSEYEIFSNWDYLNPGDEIELEVLLVPGKHPEMSSLEVDGEKIVAKKKKMKLKNC